MAFGLPPHARLFPLRKNSKQPAIKDWPRLATSDQGTLDTWFKRTFKGHNAAVATGNGLMVLDVDVKHHNGLESLDLMDAMGLPKSYRVETPSGGCHVYLEVEEPIGNSVNRLEGFPGIDVRGENGYVVAPGSAYNGGVYQPLADNQPLERAPEWIVELCRKKRHEKTNTGQPAAELDTPHNLQRAEDYLFKHAGPAISGEGGNDHTFKVAARVRDFGVSEGHAFELLSLWNVHNEPPWDHEDLERITENAFKYATAQWGGASGLAEFEPVEILETPKKPKKLYYLSYDDTLDRVLSEKQDPLIDGLIDRFAAVVMYGASNLAKTFLALDLSFHIAAGIPWRGHAVAQGAVVYVAAEGGRGILKRVAALKRKHGLSNVPLYIIPCPIDLLNSNADLKELLALVAEAQALAKVPVQLVVLDTLSRAMAGGDENSSTDMGELVRKIDTIRVKAKTAALTVHHSGKDAAKGARGHSLLRAATDTEIEVTKGLMSVTKQRDIEEMKPVKFKLEDVEIGTDPAGKKIGSAVVKWLTGSEFEDPLEISTEAADMLEALEHAIEAGGKGWASVKEWHAQYRENQGSTCKVTDHTLWEYRKQLEESGWVKKIKHNQWVKVELEPKAQVEPT